MKDLETKKTSDEIKIFMMYSLNLMKDIYVEEGGSIRPRPSRRTKKSSWIWFEQK